MAKDVLRDDRFAVKNSLFQPLLRTGEFAKLAQTTKRTLFWYNQQGILKPIKIDESGFHYYSPQQIIDFQVISLLRKMNVSLEQIEIYLSKNKTLKDLFLLQKRLLEQEVNSLQRSLNNVNLYYENLDSTGNFIKPTLKKVASFKIYYIEKQGSYNKIFDYCKELASYFKNLPKDTAFLTIFLQDEFQPKNAHMKIGLVYSKQLKLKKTASSVVKTAQIPAFQALTYIHNGSQSLGSLIWKLIYDFMRNKSYKHDHSLPFGNLELYSNFLEESEEKLIEFYYPGVK